MPIRCPCRVCLESIAYAYLEEMTLQSGRGLDRTHGIPAVELQLVGFEEAVARLEGNVIGKLVAQSPADLIGEHRIGAGKLGHIVRGGSCGHMLGVQEAPGGRVASLTASEAACASAWSSYFTPLQSTWTNPMPPPMKGLQREPSLKSYQTFTMEPNCSAGPTLGY